MLYGRGEPREVEGDPGRFHPRYWLVKITDSSGRQWGSHNESTYGYSDESLRMVVDAVGPESATAIVESNAERYLGLMTAGSSELGAS